MLKDLVLLAGSLLGLGAAGGVAVLVPLALSVRRDLRRTGEAMARREVSDFAETVIMGEPPASESRPA